MVSRNTNLGNDALRRTLLDKFLLFGQTEDSKLSNVPEASSNAIRDAVFATPILDKHIKDVAIVPSGTQALWKTGRDEGTISGMYRSDGGALYGTNISSSNWFTFVTSEGYVFVVLQNVLNGNINNDPIRAESILSDTSGKPFVTSDGIHAQCVGVVKDGDPFNSYRKHITVEPLNRVYDTLNHTFTSANSRATSICGSGNERRYGTCCLYYSSQHHDKIRGVTYDAGDFYRCTETECYRCSEMAESLGMQYRFNKWDGSGVTGGTGENCLHCDSEDFPSNCGPCECTINWNEITYLYDTILNDKNISPNTSAHKNATIAKMNKSYGGCITSVVVELNKFSPTERQLASDYRYQDVPLPLVGDFNSGESPQVYLKTEIDSDGNKIWTGFDIVNRGSGASFSEIDYTALLTYLPNTTVSKLQKYTKVFISPLDGFALSMSEWLQLRTLLDIQIQRSSVSNITNVSSINTVSIAEGGGGKGGNLFTGIEKNEPSFVALVTKAEVENPDATSAPSGGGKGGISPDQNSYDQSISSGDTIKGGSILYSKSQADVTKADIEVTGLQKDFLKVGDTLTFDNDEEWTINSVERPTAPNGDDIDERTIKIHHTHPFTVSQDINRGTTENRNSNTFNVQIYL